MVDYLYSKGKRFVVMGPPRMLDFDLKKAAELDRIIRYCLKRLEQMALRDLDKDLLFTLKSKIVKKCATPTQIVKFMTEETKVEFKEESVQVMYKNKVEDDNLPKEASATDKDEDEDEASRDSKIASPNSKEDSGKRSASGDHPSDFPLPADEDEVKQEAQQGEDDSGKGKEEEEGNEVESSTLLDHLGDNGEWQDRQGDSGFLDVPQDQEVEKPVESDEVKAGREGEGRELVETYEPSSPGIYTASMTVDHSLLEMAMDLQLQWKTKPKNVLVVKKLNERDFNEGFVDLIIWLKKEHKDMKVFVESVALEEASFKETPGSDKVAKLCEVLSKGGAGESDIDLAVSIGGDGTLLHTASLFPQRMPPVAAFRTGTLNFLVPFKFEKQSVQAVLKRILSGCAHVNLRSRINCLIKGADGSRQGEHTALNEIAVTCGSNPYLCKVEVLMDKKRLARVEGDGLLICTPTGSTAYALSAGGSVLHPAVPCMQVVPIAPHTICTRSIVVPGSAEITFRLEEDSRGNATISSDGKKAFTKSSSQELVIKASYYPVPILYGVPGEQDGESAWLKSFHSCRKLEAPPPRDDKIPKCKACEPISTRSYSESGLHGE